MIKRSLGTLLAVLLSSPLAGAQEPLTEPGSDPAARPAKLFGREDALDITLRAPWRQLQREAKTPRAYPAEIEYTDELGHHVVLPLTVERRGVKRQEACAFPPIRLRFDKQDVEDTTFRGQKSLKMVTHCDRGAKYEQYYIVEFLIFRAYNLLTDYSFRVRPLSVIYEDSERGKAGDPKFAFLIEDDSDLAKRNGLEKLRIPSISSERMQPDLAALFGLFQYMIGNVDWAALRGPDPDECCHNVKLIAPEPLGEDDWVYPVPYDFDSAGLVNAEYAAPPQGLPIRRVTQRLYRGYCWHNDSLPGARRLLTGKMPEILALFADNEQLSSGNRKFTVRYLERFNEIIEDDEEFQDDIVSKCRGRSNPGD